METGTKYIVFIDYSEPDMAPNCPGFDSQPRFYYAANMDQARERIKTEYDKTIAYAKVIGIDTEDEDVFDAWMDQYNESYEIFAEDRFFEKAKIYEAEKA